MFESALLLALFGIIIWVILAKGDTTTPRRATFINLVSELKPAQKPGSEQDH